MTDVITLTEELYAKTASKLRPLIDPAFTISWIGTIELEPGAIADKYGPRPKEEKKEYRTLNDIYKDTVPVEDFYRFMRGKGIEVYEKPQEHIARTFGYARDAHGTAAYPIGWRTGNEIYIARNDGKRYLTDDEKTAVAAHEYAAGHDHERSDVEAQRYAIHLLSPEGEFPNVAAHRKAIELAPRVGLYNFSLN